MTFVLHRLLMESAARRPEAIAVRCEDRSLTYGELDEKSNGLAHALIDAGVQRGDRIGLYLPKSIETVIGIFGILKAGACYVPLDLGAPAARLVDIANQCGILCLISSADAAAKLSEALPATPTIGHFFFGDRLPAEPLARVRSVSFERIFQETARHPLDVPVVSHDLAYILFTSGSTGKPKGVMLSHLNALTFVDWGCDTFSIGPHDRLSNHAPFSFDLSVFDLFAAIKAGATVSLIPDGLALFPYRLAEMIEQHRISIWYSVPSVLITLLTKGKLSERNLEALRVVLFAGEVFPVKYLRDLQKALPNRRFGNLYGPTETNVCTWYDVPPIPDDQTVPIPIGKACTNTDVFALDESGRKITGPGKEGLLYARGPIVMQGYFGRIEETARCFIDNPLTPWRKEPLYCTGDWVTLDEEGNYLFVGRKDHMIKVRGYRIELGEIESALYTHPAIREAVAIPIPDDLQGNRIKVFVVATEGKDLTALDVKRHCARALPKYMVPDEVELRATLPRTATDKIDRPRLMAEG